MPIPNHRIKRDEAALLEVEIWMYCLRKSNNLINKIHERVHRIAYGDYESNFNALLEKGSPISIHQRNIQPLATDVFRTKNLNPSFMKFIIIILEITIFLIQIPRRYLMD